MFANKPSALFLSILLYLKAISKDRQSQHRTMDRIAKSAQKELWRWLLKKPTFETCITMKMTWNLGYFWIAQKIVSSRKICKICGILCCEDDDPCFYATYWCHECEVKRGDGIPCDECLEEQKRRFEQNEEDY